MPKVIMYSQEYGAEEFSCASIDEAGDTIRSLAMKAYEELLSGDGVERTFLIIPDDQVELGLTSI